MLEVTAGSARALVLTDTFLSGWEATIDGTPTDIVRCNHSQRLVVLPERACRVCFTYRAPGLLAGVVLAAVASLLAALGWRMLGRRAFLPDPAAQG